ncbi:hypothetical protein AC579_7772 [Pseudocercospora musae]|uniref:Signal peptidase complex catalytic subunit SEC11 n=1 Tax=Pseudocercospora musae TaxID=113226 RepID=A0A139IK38_9PEZI|nr:hypothetical protein AC579_7772 [Pseudocercospora musae]
MRKSLLNALPLALSACNVFVAWKIWSLITGSTIPAMVVISESMAPAFHRGDLILLWNRTRNINVGDIPVVWFEEQSLPMVHRCIQSYWEAGQDGPRQHFLTKGDNNDVDDVGLYPPGRTSVHRNEVVGNVAAYVPFLGWLAIAPREVLHKVLVASSRYRVVSRR